MNYREFKEKQEEEIQKAFQDYKKRILWTELGVAYIG